MEDLIFTARGCVAEALAGSSVRTEIGPAQTVDRLKWRCWVRAGWCGAGGNTVAAGVDLHDRTVRLEHRPNDGGNSWTVHPMKRLRERDHSEQSHAGGKLLSAQPSPRDVRAPLLDGSASSLVKHAGVRVEPDHVVKQVREPQRDDTRPTPDIEKTTATVQPKDLRQRAREPLGIWDPPAPVIVSGSVKKTGVPLPILPPESGAL